MTEGRGMISQAAEGAGLHFSKPLSFALLWLTLGLIAAGLWTDIVGYSINLLSSGSNDNTAFNRDGYLLGRLFIGLIFAAFATKLPKVKNGFVGVSALLMSVATGVLIISYHQTLIDPDLFSTAGVFVAGCGYTVIVYSFYVLFAQKIATESAVSCIAISLVCETILSILASLYAPAVIQMVVVMIAPLLAAACYLLAQRLVIKVPDIPAFQTRVHQFDKYAMIVILMIFAAVLVFIRILSNIGIWGETRTNFAGITELSGGELGIIAAVVLLLSYLVFILPRRKLTLALRCIIGFAVLLGGLQILALADSSQFGLFFDSITTAIELFSHLVYWMIFIECIRKTNTPYFLVAAIGSVLYALLTLAWARWFSHLEFATSTFVMIVVYLLLLAVMAIFLWSHFVPESLFWPRSSLENKATLMSFSHRWGLSPRESEIFELLLQGKKRSEIEQECSLSEGTVKTHISNIYKKLDLHSKRELIELFEKSIAGPNGGLT